MSGLNTLDRAIEVHDRRDTLRNVFRRWGVERTRGKQAVPWFAQPQMDIAEAADRMGVGRGVAYQLETTAKAKLLLALELPWNRGVRAEAEAFVGRR